MGYYLTKLTNLPIEEDIDIYIFIINEYSWKGGLLESIQNNFKKLADSIGPRAIIIEGTSKRFYGEVVEKYLGSNYEKLKSLLPALLITDTHPEKLTEESLRVIIPLREVDSQYEIIDNFLCDLVALARGENDNLLRTLESTPKLYELLDGVIEVKLQGTEIIYAVNLGRGIVNLREWYTRYKKDRNRFIEC